MKTIALILLAPFYITGAYAQQGISYQAIARDTTGNIMANHSLTLQFSIRDAAPGGTIVYQESHLVTTNELGLFQVAVGQGSATVGNFSAVEWSVQPKFLQMEIDPGGFGFYIDMGTQQLLSVPYAMHAETSSKTTGAVTYAGSWNASSNSPPLISSNGEKGNYYVVSVAGITSLDGITDWEIGDWAIYNGTIWEKVDNTDSPVNGKVNRAGDTMTGDLILNADPTTALGAVTKQYADATEAALQTQVSAKVHRAGDTMTGDLILNADPTTALGAVTKQYADATDVALQTQVSAKVHRAGDTMTGDLILNADPTQPLGAVTLQLLESQFADLIDSYIHRTDDNLTIYGTPTGKRLGIGNQTPDAPLGIKATGSDERLISLNSQDSGNNLNWLFGLHAAGNDSGGLNIQDASGSVSLSRLFIEKSTGFIGLGTVTPESKLQITDSAGNGITGIKILNTATAGNQGWKIGHLQDQLSARDGALIFSEDIAFSPGQGTTRLTVLPGGNVGINESIPDAKLHVTRPISDPDAHLDLVEGTGIAVIGPITDNLVFDFEGIQARHGEFIGPVLDLQVSTLNLQPLGGDLLIHGSSTADENKVTIQDDGKLGLGILTPSEKLHVNGKFIIGNDAPEVSSESVSGLITNTAVSSGGTANRVGLKLYCNGPWSGDPLSKNIGLYVSDVNGQSSSSANIAAVMNGNVVIGNITADREIGINGQNVLAIQNGNAPVTPASSAPFPGGGVQLYSISDVSGVSVLHVMNGDGTVIQLYRLTPLIPANNFPISTTTYGSTEADVINNLRERINELEAKLQALGLLN
jgi:hypothetical protein